MKNKIFRLVTALLFVLVFAQVSFALELTIEGAMVGVSYTEPSSNADIPPTALTDLSHTTIFYDIGAGLVEGLQVPASINTGGGLIATQVLVPVLDGMEVDVVISVTSTDLTGNSKGSVEKVIRIDRLAPGLIQ